MTETIKSLKKKADKLWGQIVRFNGKCELCNFKGFMEAHHIIPRKNLSTRYDLKNGVCLCKEHHDFGDYSAHKDHPLFTEWLKSHKPGILEYLEGKKYKITKRTKADYVELVDDLQAVLDWKKNEKEEGDD